MKKFISFILILLMLLPCVSLFASAWDIDDGVIQNFINDSLELINRAPDIMEITVSNNGTIQSIEDFDTYSEFETCRLIVESKEKPDKLNSVGIASGFMDYHIVQFTNEYDTETAFEYYSKQEDVISVYPDEIITLSAFETDEVIISEQAEVPERLDSWGADYIGLYDLKDYLINNSVQMNETIVAVVDTGVDLDHEFLQGRLIETGFNSSTSGKENSESDKYHGHGTMVSSVIVDSTPANVKVAVYRIFSDFGDATTSQAALGLLQAVEDNVDIINASFAMRNNKGLLSDAVKYAFDNNIPVVAAAGNESVYVDTSEELYPAKCPQTITVASVWKDYKPSSFTNFGKSVDICAPGEKIKVADIKNAYTTASGTSFSSPYVASVCAIYKSLNPDYTVDEVKEKLKETASPHNELISLHDKVTEMYGAGVVNASGITDLEKQADITVNIDPGDYFDTISVELSSKGADEIYYTLNQTTPTKANGNLYTGPIEISADCVALRAVAYSNGKIRSNVFSGFYKSWIEESEENFTINGSGKILSYTGTSSYVFIPKTINGTTVTDISNGVFDNSKVRGVMLPETITTLTGGFYKNEKIDFVYGESITEIGDGALQKSNVSYVYFPNVEKVGKSAFSGTLNLLGVDFPKLKLADESAFANNKMLYMYFPELETAGIKCFSNCYNLIEIYVPKLKNVWNMPTKKNSYWFQHSQIFNALDLPLVETVYENDFISYEEYAVERIEFSNLKKLGGLPSSSTGILSYEMVLPATIEEITVNSSQFGNGSYTFYGTAGTIVEEFVKKQNSGAKRFVELTPENAVVTDLPEYYKSYMGELEPDIMGFNRTYQWYANTVDSNECGTPIEGATNKKFNPADYPAPYYYCEVTSTDVGYEPMIIKTSACENRSVEFVDYSSLEEVLNKVPEDLSIYTAETRENLESLIAEVETLDGLNQKQIDELTEKIEKAISDLKLITITLSDNEITLVREDVFTISAESELAVTWSSTNKDVATVDQNGVVTAQGKGESTIVATIESIGVTAECKVTVIPKMFTVAWIVDNNQSVVTVNEGDVIIKPENPEKHGYTFIGWNKSIPNIMPSENLEFIALWEKNSHTVTWVIDGEKIVDTYHYGDTIMVPDNPTKEGYTFDGWDAEVLHTVPDKDLVYTAKWKINSYTVKWNIDGEFIEEVYDYGTKITEPETPKKEGYIFVGWDKTIPDTMPSENLEFTAVFEEVVVMSIKIKSMPIKLDYIYKSENLDLTGLTLEISYSNGTKEILNDLSEVKVTGFDNAKTGTQTVTVEYAGEKAELNVTVFYAWWQYLILIFLFGWIWY